jgi:hypothetical protein
MMRPGFASSQLKVCKQRQQDVCVFGLVLGLLLDKRTHTTLPGNCTAQLNMALHLLQRRTCYKCWYRSHPAQRQHCWKSQHLQHTLGQVSGLLGCMLWSAL